MIEPPFNEDEGQKAIPVFRTDIGSINERSSLMPLLPLEPFIYPPDLLTKLGQTVEATEKWWVLYTRPRAEKVLARKLLVYWFSENRNFAFERVAKF